MITPQIRKAFALASISGAIIRSSESKTLKAVTLLNQVNNAMKVFNKVAGAKEYWNISLGVQDIWKRMEAKYETVLDEDELEVYVEMILSLIPKPQMKKFLNYNFTSSFDIREDNRDNVLVSVLELDSELNTLLDTTDTANRDSLCKVLVKPIKASKVAVQRDIGVEHRIKKLRKRIAYVKSKLNN